MKPPGQAAILCGGLGTRLRPITDTLPKPLAPVNNRPFLSYLLEQLYDNGIRECVLMTGYLGDKIQDYYGDGSRFHLHITYAHGPVEWDTGRRLWEAKDLLKEYFLLLYSDNFAQFDLKKMTTFYSQKNKLLSFLVTAKKNGNIRIGNDGDVSCYDKSRVAENLDYVELGYMLVCKQVFKYYSESNVSFSNIISLLVADNQVAGLSLYDNYYSISDPERLKIMEAYLTDKKIILLDRDGVINKKASKATYIAQWKSFEFIPENIEGLRQIAKAGYQFIVISNQAGIERGMLSWEIVDHINNNMRQALKSQGISVIAVYTCPHHWDTGCFCRKPNPGLFIQAAKEYLFRLDKTVYIGDDIRDCQAAYNAGCKSVYLGYPSDLENLPEKEKPIAIFDNVNQAVPTIHSTLGS
ncbi:MAG: HAD-IIIA family hydrolase [Fibrobacteria bacterium]|nr:HAD-IIIA family hydrolase [Fibrobacteria bacterium]